MDWLRLYHGTTSDPKWVIIARKSGTNIGTVVSIWLALLEHASQADERGSVASFDPEVIDALYGYEDGTTAAVVQALEEKCLIRAGWITAWNRRQPKRERDDSSAERVRQHRQRQKEQELHTDNQCNATVTPHVTQETPREEKIREEKNIISHTQGLPENEGRVREAGGAPEGEVFDSSPLPVPEISPLPACIDEPGIEFLELRRHYDEHARAEAPLVGFAEYKQLRASRQWPGQSAIYGGIDYHARDNPQWKKGFAPSLARFLREKWWQQKKLCIERLDYRQNAPPLPITYAQAQDMERRQRAARVLQRMEQQHGNV